MPLAGAPRGARANQAQSPEKAISKKTVSYLPRRRPHLAEYAPI